jgi:myotubularin-related protein 5/13
VSNLEVWDFFVGEDLGRGSSYDFETAELDDGGGALAKNRRVVMAGYDCVDACSLSGCMQVLEGLRSAQMKLGRLPQMWKHVWDKLEMPNTGTLPVSWLFSYLIYEFPLLLWPFLHFLLFLVPHPWHLSFAVSFNKILDFFVIRLHCN